MDREAFKARFDAEMQQLLADGMEVNAAAAEAVRRACQAPRGGRERDEEMDLEHAKRRAGAAPADSMELSGAPELEEVPAEPAEPPAPPVDLDSLEAALAEAREGAEEGLLGMLEAVLARGDGLASSFVGPGDEGALRIDVAAAERFWEVAAEAGELREDLGARIRGLLEANPGLVERRSESGAAGSGDAAAWARQVGISLLNASLSDPEYHGALKELCQSVSALPAAQALRLAGWLGTLDAERFEGLVLTLQQHLTLVWLLEEEAPPPAPPGSKPLGNVLHAVRLLSLFFSANGGRGPGSLGDDLLFRRCAGNGDATELAEQVNKAALMDKGRLVSWGAFYSDTVNTGVMAPPGALERQYRDWVRDTSHKIDRRKAQDLAAGAANAGGDNGEDAAPVFARLGLVRSLLSFPFLLEPAVKAQILSLDAELQMRHQFRQEVDLAIQTSIFSGRTAPARVDPYMHLNVGRETIVGDTLDQVVLMPDFFFKKQLRVQFRGEDGVDEGGVQKEFFQIIMRNLLQSDYDIFSRYGDRLLFFNPDTMEEAPTFELVGILLGVAIYNGIILDLPFPLFTYKKLLGEPEVALGLADLAAVKPEVAASLEAFLGLDDAAAEGMEQTWCLTYESFMFGERQVRTVELVPGGEEKLVRPEERGAYVEAFVRWWLVDSVAKSFGAFKRGFWKVCGGRILDYFRAEELELLICGNPTLNFEELEEAASYADGYTTDSLIIRQLWVVVHGLTDDEKRAFLKFVTGSDRAPIRGLGSLRLVVSKNGGDSDRLPTSHTCFNHLLLPEYGSIDRLRDRLILAIQNGTEGFGLR